MELLLAIWYFLPAGLANAAPVFANKIPLLNRWKTPVDFGKTYSGKRITGDNKTWRGITFGLFVAIVTICIQREIALPRAGESEFFAEAVELMHLASPDFWMLGLVLGLGALAGDVFESFVKRQHGVPSGHSWFPFDQLDYIIGGLLTSAIYAPLSPLGYLLVVLVWFGVHLVATYIGYRVGLRDKPI